MKVDTPEGETFVRYIHTLPPSTHPDWYWYRWWLATHNDSKKTTIKAEAKQLSEMTRLVTDLTYWVIRGRA